jgi:hypothetical protein
MICIDVNVHNLFKGNMVFCMPFGVLVNEFIWLSLGNFASSSSLRTTHQVNHVYVSFLHAVHVSLHLSAAESMTLCVIFPCMHLLSAFLSW